MARAPCLSWLAVLIALWSGPAFAAGSACDALTGLMHQKTGAPVFLTSYPTVTDGPLAGVAFTYDNATAVIALIACGEKGQAARIGDAFLAAQDHDRYWHDGRLRNGYLAGPVRDMPLKLPGWWDDKQNMWVEDQYQAGSDNGNQAWAMLALLALNEAGAGAKYLAGAARLGAYVETSRDTHGPGGFNGGVFGDEPGPAPNRWKSTEHNTDLAAAFARLAAATGDTRWRSDADAAAAFVRAMWRDDCSCFAVGTGEDGQTRNPFLALDAQLWPLLAVPGFSGSFPAALDTVEARMTDGGGFSYSEAKEGMWTEGTAQAVLLFELSGRDERAAPLLKAIDGNRSPDGSYYAANVKDLPTGFMLQTDPNQPRVYFHISHLAALSWTALAQEKFNPFTGNRALPRQDPEPGTSR